MKRAPSYHISKAPAACKEPCLERCLLPHLPYKAIRFNMSICIWLARACCRFPLINQHCLKATPTESHPHVCRHEASRAASDCLRYLFISPENFAAAQMDLLCAMSDALASLMVHISQALSAPFLLTSQAFAA